MTKKQPKKQETNPRVGEETSLEILAQLLKFLGPIVSIGASATLIFRNTWIQTSNSSNFVFLSVMMFLGITIWFSGFWLGGKEKTKRLQQAENEKKHP